MNYGTITEDQLKFLQYKTLTLSFIGYPNGRYDDEWYEFRFNKEGIIYFKDDASRRIDVSGYIVDTDLDFSQYYPYWFKSFIIKILNDFNVFFPEWPHLLNKGYNQVSAELSVEYEDEDPPYDFHHKSLWKESLTIPLKSGKKTIIYG